MCPDCSLHSSVRPPSAPSVIAASREPNTTLRARGVSAPRLPRDGPHSTSVARQAHRRRLLGLSEFCDSETLTRDLGHRRFAWRFGIGSVVLVQPTYSKLAP